MTNAVDILLASDGSLQFNNGDFVTGHSDGQHQQHILFAEQGAYRQYPLMGIGIRRMLNTKLSPLQQLTLRTQISQQLQADGFKAPTVNLLPKATGRGYDLYIKADRK